MPRRAADAAIAAARIGWWRGRRLVTVALPLVEAVT
jgi:hypothetical protein